MLQGQLGLNHPALNPSPAFRRAAVDDASKHQTLILIEPSESDPSQALQDVCELNQESAETIKERNQTYQSLKASGERNEAWEAFEETQDGLRSRWEDLSAQYGDNLKFVSALASALSSNMGPTIMTAYEDLGDGLCRVELSKQTTRENLGAEELTGDTYLSRDLDGSVSGAKVTTDTPYFGATRATVVVEPARGMAMVYRNMRTTELGLTFLD